MGIVRTGPDRYRSERKKYKEALALQEEMLDEAEKIFVTVSPNQGYSKSGFGYQGVNNTAWQENPSNGPFSLVKKYGEVRLKEIFKMYEL